MKRAVTGALISRARRPWVWFAVTVVWRATSMLVFADMDTWGELLNELAHPHTFLAMLMVAADLLVGSSAAEAGSPMNRKVR